MGRGKLKIPKGFVSYKQLAQLLNISSVTLWKRMKPLRPFLNMPPSGRKDLYPPAEVKFILKNIQ